MPSTVMVPLSGGIGLVLSGQGFLFSGTWNAIKGGIRLRYDVSGPGVVYVQPWPTLSGGFPVTATSGGSGGFGSGTQNWTDGWPLGKGDQFFIPKARLSSGLETPRFAVPAAASGGFLFWAIE